MNVIKLNLAILLIFVLTFTSGCAGMKNKELEDLLRDAELSAHGWFDMAYNESISSDPNWDLVIKCYKKAIELNPDLPEAHYNLGLAYVKKGKYGKGIASYKKAVELKPDFALAHYRLGATYGAKGKYNEAITNYKKAIELKPDYADAYHGLGLAYGGKRLYDKEIASYRKAIELKPDYANAYHGLGLAYIDKGSKYVAADYFYKAGLLFLEQGDRKNAVSVYDNMRQFTPNSELTYKLHRKLYLEPLPEEKVKEVKPLILEVEIDKAPIRKVTCKDGYAVVIGIEKYRDLPQVEFAQRDAQVLREYLIKTMGFPKQNVVTLLNERALRSDLGKYFETWLKNNVNKDSTLFIYYSGHGAPGVEDDKAYLVPWDGDPNYPEKTCYPLDSLYASLNKLPAKQIIVAIDSCFSGVGGRSVVAEGSRPMYISVENPMLASGNIVVLTAATEKQIASFYPEAKHGLFTYFFLRGLRGDGDLDGDGWVELKELFDYLKPEVIGIARRMNREQTPVVLPSPELLGKRGEYRLTKTSGELPVQADRLTAEDWWWMAHNEGMSSRPNWDLVIKWFKKSIELRPDYAVAHWGLGLAYYKQKLYDKAIESHMKAIELKPDDAGAHAALGEAYLEKGLYDKAIVSLKKAIALEPDIARADYLLGLAYHNRELYNEAIASYKKAIELKPDDAGAHTGLGLAYVMKKFEYMAADHFYRAGLLYLEQGNREGALMAYDNMKYFMPNSKLTSKLHRKLYPE